MEQTNSRFSTLAVLVQIAWVGLILVCLYLAVGIPVGLANPKIIRPWLGVCFWSPGLVIGLPWESLSPEQWRSYLVPVGLWGMIGTASILYAVGQVRRILKDSTCKSPFTSANSERVRKAGLAVLCSAAAKAFRDISFGHFLVANVKVPGVNIGYGSDLGLSTAFLAVMILAVAEVMRRGVNLQEEQDLTV